MKLAVIMALEEARAGLAHGVFRREVVQEEEESGMIFPIEKLRSAT